MLFSVLFFTLIVSACNIDKKNNNEILDSELDDVSDAAGNVKEVNNSLNEQLVNTIIRWGVPDLFQISEEALNRFNHTILEKGYDFRVEFIPLNYDDYYESLKLYEKDNGSLDISFAGLNSIVGNESFSLVNTGYFTSLDIYLSSPEGDDLYQLLPPLLWDAVKVNNTIYTIPNGIAKDIGIKYIFNKAYISEEELQGFTGDLSELKSLMERIPIQNSFSHIIYELDKFSFSDLIKCDYHYGLMLSHELKGAYSPFELKSVREYYEIVHDYYQSGYINYDMSFVHHNEQSEIHKEYLNKGDFFVYILIDELENLPNINADTFVLDMDAYMRSRISGSVGIASQSTKKDEAFQLLSLVHTDRELANLLVYGSLGIDYQLINGIAYELDGGVPDPFLNKLLMGVYENLYPTEAESFVVDRITDKKEYYKHHVKDSPYLGKHFDTKGYESIITEVVNILEANIDLWNSDDLDMEFDRVNELLKEAGIDDLILEMNEQLGL